MTRHWNPLQDLMLLQDRMNRLFEDATERQSRVKAEAADEIDGVEWYPAADVYDKEGEYLIAMDLPGIDRSALEISLDESRLVIRGSRSIQHGEPATSQRPQGRFLRTFTIPTQIDQHQIKAEHQNGVLEVRLPKRKEQQGQRIQIKVQ